MDNIFTGTDLNVKFAGKVWQKCNRVGDNALYDHAIQRVLKYWNYIMNFNFTQSGNSFIFRTYIRSANGSKAVENGVMPKVDILITNTTSDTLFANVSLKLELPTSTKIVIGNLGIFMWYCIYKIDGRIDYSGYDIAFFSYYHIEIDEGLSTYSRE